MGVLPRKGMLTQKGRVPKTQLRMNRDEGGARRSQECFSPNKDNTHLPTLRTDLLTDHYELAWIIDTQDHLFNSSYDEPGPSQKDAPPTVPDTGGGASR